MLSADVGAQGQAQGNFDDLHQFLQDVEHSPLSLFASPSNPLAATDASSSNLKFDHPLRISQMAHRPPQVEDIASWGDVSFLISLHVQYQHALVPLCHQPSLARDILHRRDQKDEAFRCFLLSIGMSKRRVMRKTDASVVYVRLSATASRSCSPNSICQCPVQSLLARLTRETLEALLRRAQRATRVIQIRHQMKPSLLILASTVLWVTLALVFLP